MKGDQTTGTRQHREQLDKKSLYLCASVAKSCKIMGLAVILLALVACAPAAASASQKSMDATPGASGPVQTAVAATLTEMPLASQTPSATPLPSNTPLPSATPSPSPTATPIPTVTPDTRLDPNSWASWPVIPTVSARAREIYLAGMAAGNDPRSFSSIGDCQSEPAVFLGIYDTKRYILGKDDQYLQETIDFFAGKFGRQSLAVRDGLSAPSALSVQWAYADKCHANENPVQCDLRVHKPAIVFINLGTNWRADASVDAYEKYLRQIVELVIANGTVPVLSTKADNVEGGNRINLATARVAHDYDVPLWNFWLTAQYLTDKGLDKTRKDVYLTVEAWDARSYTALKILDRLRRDFQTIYDPNQSTK